MHYTIQEKRRFEKYIKSTVCYNFKLWQGAFLKKSFFHCVCFIKGIGYSTFSDAFTFVILIVVLCVKPTGLFGEKATDKV